MLGAMAVTVPEIDRFDPTVLQHQLDGHQAEVRERVRELLCRPEFTPPVAAPTPAYREQVLAWCEALAREGLPSYGFPKEVGGQGNPSAAVAVFETLAYGDLSLLVKFGVQFGLWGGAVQQLGTERHHERYLGEIMRLGSRGRRDHAPRRAPRAPRGTPASPRRDAPSPPHPGAPGWTSPR